MTGWVFSQERPRPPLDRLYRQIRGAGIPIDGVSGISSTTYRIDFRPEATAPQRAQANSIAQTFDWRRRRNRPYNDLVADINALSVADRQRLINLVLADFLREHPNFAIRFGINVDGEEPEP